MLGTLLFATALQRGSVTAVAALVLCAGAGPAVYSSLTLAGQYLFLNSNKGETVVLETTRQARLVRRNKLPAGSGSSPIFSGHEMFQRDGDRLFCIGETAGR